MLYAVRGAIGIDADIPEYIQEAVEQLMKALIEQNDLKPEEILTVFFTVTNDIITMNPAMALRTALPDWGRVPLLCAVEPGVDLLSYCIRVLVQWQPKKAPKQVTPVYLGNAEQLRPDLMR